MQCVSVVYAAFYEYRVDKTNARLTQTAYARKTECSKYYHLARPHVFEMITLQGCMHLIKYLLDVISGCRIRKQSSKKTAKAACKQDGDSDARHIAGNDLS